MHEELIAALEKATGPDRELDARIWCHLNGKKYIGHATPYGEREGLFVQVEYTKPPKRTRKVTNFPHVPHALCVTASIDAALTLVPEGWRSYSADFSVRGRARWVLEGPKTQWARDECDERCAGDDWYAQGIAPTPALAIVIAAIKADVGGDG